MGLKAKGTKIKLQEMLRGVYHIILYIVLLYIALHIVYHIKRHIVDCGYEKDVSSNILERLKIIS